AQLFDGCIFPLQEFYEGQDGSQQPLDFLLGPRVQIRPSNLLDQTFNFGRAGSRSLVVFGHGRTRTFSVGMTASTANHYHSSRFIGRSHRPMHTFFSNTRWLTEGTPSSYPL